MSRSPKMITTVAVICMVIPQLSQAVEPIHESQGVWPQGGKKAEFLGSCTTIGQPCQDLGPDTCCPNLKCSDVNRRGVICNPTQAPEALLDVAAGAAMTTQAVEPIHESQDVWPQGGKKAEFLGSCATIGQPCPVPGHGPDTCCPTFNGLSLKCSYVNRQGGVWQCLPKPRSVEPIHESQGVWPQGGKKAEFLGSCTTIGQPCQDLGPDTCCPNLKCSYVNRQGVICNPTQAPEALLDVAAGPAMTTTHIVAVAPPLKALTSTGLPDCSKTACPAKCQCGTQKCASQIKDCLADKSCAAGETCANACPCGSLACLAGCAAKHPTAKGFAVLSCVQTACPNSELSELSTVVV